MAGSVTVDVLAERLEALRGDVSGLAEEHQRMRTRLHNLEGFAAAYLDQQRANRRAEDRQYRRLEVRMQVLTLVVGIAAVFAPLIIVLLTGK